MQRRPCRIVEWELRTFEDCDGHGKPGSRGVDYVTRFLDFASADESVKVRTRQELNLLNAITAHPSYTAGRKIEPTEGTSHVKRIPG
jgi:hypothetical protein